MAIFGIGAFWDDHDDKTDEFVINGKACIGWWPTDVPSLYKLLRTVKVGDIIYIKSTPPGELRIKAVGIVTDGDSFPYDDNAKQNGVFNCLHVKWLWHGGPVIITAKDKYNVRNNSLYEESGFAQESSDTVYVFNSSILESGDSQDTPSTTEIHTINIIETGSIIDSSSNIITTSIEMIELGNAQDYEFENAAGTTAIFENGNAQEISTAYISIVHLWNGIHLYHHTIPENTDVRLNIGSTIIGIPIVEATDDSNGAVRIMVNSNVYALQQSISQTWKNVV